MYLFNNGKTIILGPVHFSWEILRAMLHTHYRQVFTINKKATSVSHMKKAHQATCTSRFRTWQVPPMWSLKQSNFSIGGGAGACTPCLTLLRDIMSQALPCSWPSRAVTMIKWEILTSISDSVGTLGSGVLLYPVGLAMLRLATLYYYWGIYYNLAANGWIIELGFLWFSPVMGLGPSSTSSTSWGAYSPFCHDGAGTIQTHKQSLSNQLPIHSELRECTCKWSALSKDSLPHRNNWNPHLRPLDPMRQSIASMPQPPACIWSIMFRYVGTLRVVTARELVVLSGSFTSCSVSVRWHCDLCGHVTHERYTVSSVEGWERNLQGLSDSGHQTWAVGMRGTHTTTALLLPSPFRDLVCYPIDLFMPACCCRIISPFLFAL